MKKTFICGINVNKINDKDLFEIILVDGKYLNPYDYTYAIADKKENNGSNTFLGEYIGFRKGINSISGSLKLRIVDPFLDIRNKRIDLDENLILSYVLYRDGEKAITMDLVDNLK